MRFLLDEMFPPATAALLIAMGHDAVHVRDRGLDAQPDPVVAELARTESWILVTENVKDFARERNVVVLCVMKSRLPPSGMAAAFAEELDRWAASNGEPYAGLHWP